MYKWIEPKICSEIVEGAVDNSTGGAVKLPASGQMETCPPCNPGFSVTNTSGCEPCPHGSYSNGTGGKTPPQRNDWSKCIHGNRHYCAMFCARCYTRNIPQQLMPMFLCCQIFCHINYLLNPLCPLWDIRPLWHKCKPILTVALNPSCPYPTCADCLRAAGGQQTLSIVSLSNTLYPYSMCSLCRVSCRNRAGGGLWVQVVEQDARQHEELCLQPGVQRLSQEHG